MYEEKFGKIELDRVDGTVRDELVDRHRHRAGAEADEQDRVRLGNVGERGLLHPFH